MKLQETDRISLRATANFPYESNSCTSKAPAVNMSEAEANAKETVTKIEEKPIETLPLTGSETATPKEEKSSETQLEVTDPPLITDKMDSVNQTDNSESDIKATTIPIDFKIKSIEKDAKIEIKVADAASVSCKAELEGGKNDAKSEASIETKVESVDKDTNSKVETKVADAASDSVNIKLDDDEIKSETETKIVDATLIGTKVESANEKRESEVETKVTDTVTESATDLKLLVEDSTLKFIAANTENAVRADLERKGEDETEILGGGDVGAPCLVFKSDKNTVASGEPQDAKISISEIGEQKSSTQKETSTKIECADKTSFERSNVPTAVESKGSEPITISRLKQAVQKTAEERDVYHRKLEETERKLAALQSSYDAIMKGDSNESLLRRMVDQLKSKLIQTSLQLEDRTRLAANQEKQINALSSQVVSLKEVESITRNLLQIRNIEVKQLQANVDDMETKISQERERYSAMINKMNAAVQLNADLKKEYETQLRLFQDLRGKYEEKVTLLSNEKRALETTATAPPK
ncbi:hypothetical protein KM043_009024 [Ampulex compressa]|nr:hypothetical protein KM043_009024 [Ampulex compressa]